MKRRDLFKTLGALAVGCVAAPLAKLMPTRKVYWEGTNIVRNVFAELSESEKQIIAASGKCDMQAFLNAHVDKLSSLLHEPIVDTEKLTKMVVDTLQYHGET